MINSSLCIYENCIMSFGYTLGCSCEFLDLGPHCILWIRLKHERTHDNDSFKMRHIPKRTLDQVVINTFISFYSIKTSLPQWTIKIAPSVINSNHYRNIIWIHIDNIALPTLGHIDDIIPVDACINGA